MKALHARLSNLWESLYFDQNNDVRMLSQLTLTVTYSTSSITVIP